MDFRHISAVDWDEFRKRWPGAYAYLTERLLLGEWRALKANGRRNAWEQNRLDELETLCPWLTQEGVR